MHRKPLLTLIGVAASLSSAILFSNSAYAATTPPSVSVSIPTGTATLAPSSTFKDWNTIEVPATIVVESASSYNVSVYNSCAYMDATFLATYDPDGSKGLLSKCNAGSLVDINTGNEIKSTDSLSTLPDMTNRWGYRWQMGSKYNTAPSSDNMQKTFTTIPTTIEAGALTDIGDNGRIYLTSQGYKTKDGGDILTLEVGASVDGDLPSGNYQGAIAVTVTATPKDVASFGSLHYMQDMNAEECAKITQGTEGYLEDRRDNKLYKVAKLADNNCWMIQNLALAGGSVISSADSDIPAGSIKAGDSNVGIADTYKLPDSSSTGFTGTDTGFMYNGSYRPNTYNTQGFVASASNPNEGTEQNSGACAEDSVAGCKGDNSGAYYSWKVATANSTASVTKYDNAPASICPKGWKLPTSSEHDGAQYPTLFNLYGNNDAERNAGFKTAWHTTNPLTSLMGIIVVDNLNTSGTAARWWSRTVLSDKSTYGPHQDLEGSNFTVASGASSRYVGQSIRCVVDMTKPTMQNFTASDCSNLVGETELVDSRDNKVYKVAKLADGNCWMTQNLALDSGTTEATRRTITPDDSDVTTNYTLPVSSTTGFNSETGQFMYNGTHQGLAFGDVVYEDAKNDTNGTGDNTGAYYSWLTATANSSPSLSENQNAVGSICPSGWKLPTGGQVGASSDNPPITNGQSQSLYDAYNGDFSVFASEFGANTTGRYLHGAHGGNGGSYWTRTERADNKKSMFSVIMASNTWSVVDGSQFLGYSVRCVKTPN